MINHMTLEELAEAANSLLDSSETKNQDGRLSENVSPRRIRDYITKGLLDKPFKSGRNTYYSAHHLNQLVELRTLQSSGISEKYIRSNSYIQNNDTSEVAIGASLFSANSISGASGCAYNSTSNDDSLQNQAMAALLSMKPSVLESNVQGTMRSSRIEAPVLSKVALQSKTWVEYQLDKEGKVFLKLDPNSLPSEKEEILKAFKNILNI